MDTLSIRLIAYHSSGTIQFRRQWAKELIPPPKLINKAVKNEYFTQEMYVFKIKVK